ncbi:MAG: DoxX-like family protein [Chlorobiaceae bacterium]
MLQMRFFSGQSRVLLLCRILLALSWIYQGAVPKIVCRSSGEIELIGHVIPLYQWACMAVTWMGVAEIGFGLLILVSRGGWVFWCNIVTLTGLLLYVALFEPAMFALPFNPLTLNLSLITLSVIALLELGKIKPEQA